MKARVYQTSKPVGLPMAFHFHFRIAPATAVLATQLASQLVMLASMLASQLRAEILA